MIAIRNFFKEFSTRSEINFQEFSEKIAQLGVNITDEEKEVLFKKLDKNGDGQIDYIEWTEGLNLRDL